VFLFRNIEKIKMKVRISATIDKETKKIINSLLKDKDFRNKSHVIEKAIKLLKEIEDGKKKIK